MRKLFFIAILAGMVQTVQAQNHSIGVRLGDPIGITYKNYLSKSKSFEFGFGTSLKGWNDGYYQRSFESRTDYDGYFYNSHHVENILCFQGRFLLNYDIPVQGVEGEFDWYWGIGAVMKFASVQYFYSNNQPPYSYTDSRVDANIGPEVIVGAEYKFEDVPFTLFAEFSMMLEVGDRFGLRGMFGTGGRYVF